MKRGVFPEGVTKAVRTVESEFELFKYKTLSKSRREIFEECNAIRFYSCIYEYFLYADVIREEHIRVCLKCGDITSSLYRIYMKYEYLRYDRWEDVEELLDALARELGNGKTEAA